MKDKCNIIHTDVVSGNVVITAATLKMKVGGTTVQRSGFNVGPVNAAIPHTAIHKITKNYPLKVSHKKSRTWKIFSKSLILLVRPLGFG